MRKHFNIGYLSEIIDIPASTLRTWERRYHLFTPSRSAKGHRQYSASDVKLAQILKILLDQGTGVREAVKQARIAMFGRQAQSENQQNIWGRFLAESIVAIDNFDAANLGRTFNRAFADYPEEVVMRRLVVPIFDYLGDNWDKNPAGIAEEHFATAFFISRLSSIYNSKFIIADGISLICCCLPGERHEMGLLLFCLTLFDQGYKPIYFGADMPLDQYENVVRKLRCKGIVVSGKKDGLPTTAINELAAMTKSLGIPIFVGGNVSTATRDKLKGSGLIPVSDSFATAIEALDNHLKRG